MPHLEIQHILAMAIVAAAAWYVLNRLWKQALAFRSRPRQRQSTTPPARPAPPSVSPLIQIQTRPPVHLKRPSTDDK